MFTGIVEAVGEIKHAVAVDRGVKLSVGPGALDLADVKTGDSIALNGVCLTVIALAPGVFTVDVSQETLDCTVGFAAGAQVNLEKALRLSDRLGGHLMSGHVDGVGEVTEFTRVGESWLLTLRAPGELAQYIARKGSIAVNGVSLTVNRVAGREFSVNLIPRTLEVTTLKHLAPGARVNLEVDLLARYAGRLLEFQKSDS